ncbi:alpha/beta fold hydrolase [Streptomyces nigra]|uniref:alpha/beta fold hydrolase n=1 Tax=Streptomyces nigra TaxID=1827580 RepID=UPI00381C1ED6
MTTGTDWPLAHTFTSTSGAVRWDRLGPPEGPPVVLLHGTPFSSYVWRGVARALARDHQVFVWDMPGYGRSEKAAGQDVSLAAQGRVLTELLAHWGLEEPLVVAHDIGGAVALRAHLLHGARYRALALVDPVALAPWGSPFFRLVREHAAVFEQLPPPLHGALVRAYVSSASASGLRPDVLTARRALAGSVRAGGVLPADRAGRPAPHRRDPAPLRRHRDPRPRVLGRGGHLDPGREGTRTGRARARGAVRTAGGSRAPRPGGRARRTRGRAPRLRHTSPLSRGGVGGRGAGARESSRSACGAVGKGWHTRSSSADPLTPVGRFAKVFHHKQSGAHCATTSVERLGAWQTCSWTARGGARWPETTGRSDAPPGAPPRRRQPLPHAATAVRVPRCPDRPGG